MTQIILATHNPSKIARIKNNLQLNGIEFVTPQDLNLKIKDPAETGQNEWENAKIKAEAYFQNSKIPSLSLDTGFYFDTLDSSKQPGKDVQGSAGVLSSDDDETRFKKMTNYYQKLVAEFGTELPAYFKDVFCLFDGNKYLQTTAIRPVILTQQIVGKDVHFPLASLFKTKASKEFYHNLTPDQMLEFIQPTLSAVTQILVEFML